MAKRVTKRTTGKNAFDRVADLAHNLWWSWNPTAQQLFAALDPVQWEATNHAPLATLAQLSPQRRAHLLADEQFTKHLAACEADLKKYMRARTWFQRTAKPTQKRMLVAYFCAEFAIHESFPQYSGGLGVLAGDHLKSASDLGIPLVGVGLLYRSGYYQQSFARDGSTEVTYPEYDFNALPVKDTGKRVEVLLGRRHVQAKVWRMQVGRVSLILLDTDLPANRPADRTITQHLYGGNNETRIQQEIILGIGGVRALQALNLRPTVFHLNEGHAAFCALERLRTLRQKGRGLERAMQEVRSSTVFTTHTPVPAGHDRFAPALTMRYLGPIAKGIGLGRRDFLALGREDAKAAKEPFCMTVLALRLSQYRNGVAKIHGQVSREMWLHVHDVKKAADVPIGYVTNGVHSQTWLAPEAAALHQRYLKPRWLGAGPESPWWQNADRIPAEELWKLRNQLRRKLVHFIRGRLLLHIQGQLGPVEELAAAYETFDENALTLGFARRFATYKRAPLIFHDAKRLASILTGDRSRPVQIVFAGKAHPADTEGQAYAAKIYNFARKAGFHGRVALLDNYDMHVGRMLTSGCDVWLNNPLRPREASGTSGMKPPLHGGLNCSIPDGWWPEAYNGRNGWQIGDGRALRTPAAQDRYDVGQLYDMLEKQIVPLFYKRDRQGIARGWVKMMTASIKTVCGQFSTHRMLGDYVTQYYLPAHGK
ncbi:MAG: alpha-glucan family phosphorylase [Phycisphaerae bacterium]|nr:alpha-glucan family phosphorylase [Phycisphaerae bacterium]